MKLVLQNDLCPPYGYYHILTVDDDGLQSITGTISSSIPKSKVIYLCQQIAEQIYFCPFVDETAMDGRVIKRRR